MMPTPINSVRTRVIELADGSYVAQLTNDGMMWADLPNHQLIREVSEEPADAIYYATRVALAASNPPSMGRVIWQSTNG